MDVLGHLHMQGEFDASLLKTVSKKKKSCTQIMAQKSNFRAQHSGLGLQQE